MAVPARFVVAGMLLALTLAAVPLLIPTDFAGAGSSKPASPTAKIPALVHLSASALRLPAESWDISAPAPEDRSSRATASTEISPELSLQGVSLFGEDPASSGAVLLDAGELLADPVQDALAPAVEAPTTHTVASGDSLWQIARDAGVRVDALAAANNLSQEATLHPGQVLSIPSPSSPVPAPQEPTSAIARPAPPSRSAPRIAHPLPALLRQMQMVTPSAGTITSRFGWRIHPIFGTREFHTGLDIAARLGTPVCAARAGIVRFVGWMVGYGRLIVVDHGNGLETSYSHLSAALVGLGQRVAMGQVLGRIGNTGWSTGPHLLFEVRRNGIPLDPLAFLR